MRNSRSHSRSLPRTFSLIPFCYATIAILLVVYIGLIATVMSYATITVEFSQSVRDNRATVAQLEKEYLSKMATISSTNYLAEGYAKPVSKVFVRAKEVTALR